MTSVLQQKISNMDSSEEEMSVFVFQLLNLSKHSLSFCRTYMGRMKGFPRNSTSFSLHFFLLNKNCQQIKGSDCWMTFQQVQLLKPLEHYKQNMAHPPLNISHTYKYHTFYAQLSQPISHCHGELFNFLLHLIPKLQGIASMYNTLNKNGKFSKSSSITPGNTNQDQYIHLSSGKLHSDPPTLPLKPLICRNSLRKYY